MDFKNAAKQACQTKLEDAKSTYPFVDDGNLPYLCMDLVYQYTLLVDGFGMFCSGFGTVVHDNDVFFFFLHKIYEIIFPH